MNSHSINRLDRVMTPDQFNRVVDAILSGKYSWACVLILQFSGYNPLHYIPYRTYNRLMKDNCPPRKSKQANEAVKPLALHLEDLNHLETLQSHSNLRGGVGHSASDPWFLLSKLN